jgi:hypothetical protein
MQWMLIETFEKLAENGTGILLMVNGNEAIEDVANRYVVVSSQVVLSEGTYSDMRRLLQLF